MDSCFLYYMLTAPISSNASHLRRILLLPLLIPANIPKHYPRIQILTIRRLARGRVHPEPGRTQNIPRPNPPRHIDREPDILTHELHPEPALIPFTRWRIGTHPRHGVKRVADGILRRPRFEHGREDIGVYAGAHA